MVVWDFSSLSSETISNIHDLRIWQSAIDLTKKIYLYKKSCDLSKEYHLCDQITRASISIASNIAEGVGRGGNKEFIRFLAIARGSCTELETQIIIAHGIGLIDEDTKTSLIQDITDIHKSINALITSLRSKL